MRTCNMKLIEKQKRFIFFIEIFFLMDKIYFCEIKNFLTKIFSLMLRTLLSVISVFRLEFVNELLQKMFIALGLLDRWSHLKLPLHGVPRAVSRLPREELGLQTRRGSLIIKKK